MPHRLPPSFQRLRLRARAASNPPAESAIQTLEVKIAYVEKAVLDLDDVVRALADQVAELRREIREIREERGDGTDRQGIEVPPHY